MSDSLPPSPTQDADGIWRDAAGRRVCGAKNRDGTRCRVWVGLGAGSRCKRHGGMSLKGLAHPRLVHGRRSKWFGRWQRFFDAWATSPDRLSLETDVGIQEANIRAQLEILAGGRHVALRDFAALWTTFRAAAQSKDGARITEAVAAIDRALADAKAEQDAWRAIERAQLAKAELIDKESRRVLRVSETISAAEAFALIATVIDLVKTHVPDPVSRRAIADGLHRLTGRPTLH